jgi:DNA-directed RNA polymerase specialized sigma24 family protein
MTATTSTPLTTGVHDKVIGSPGLTRKLRKIFFARVPPQGRVAADWEDFAQDTLAKAHTLRHLLPDGEADCEQYICGIARNRARHWVRDGLRAKRHGQREAFDETDHVSAGKTPEQACADQDLIDKARAAGVRTESDMESFRWLLRHLVGESHASIAGEMGLPVKTVARRVARMQETFDKHVADLALVALVLLFVLACVLRLLRPAKDEAGPRPGPDVVQPAPAPRPEGQAHTSLDPARARALRGEAFAACRAKDWDTCETKLDRADEQDPDGALDAQVADARRVIASSRPSDKGPPR